MKSRESLIGMSLITATMTASPTIAGVTFMEDFTGLTPATALSADAAWEENAGNNAVRFANSVSDASNLFGQGTANIIAQVGMSNPGGAHQVSTTTLLEEAKGTITFDFYEADDTSRPDPIAFFFRDSGKALQQLAFDDGVLSVGGGTANYDLDRVNSVRIVFNLTGAAIALDEGVGSGLADRTYDVYLNDTLAFNDVAIVGGATAHIDDLGWDKAAGTTSLMYFDNFIIDNSAIGIVEAPVIPEPSSIMLGGLGALCLAARRRRA